MKTRQNAQKTYTQPNRLLILRPEKDAKSYGLHTYSICLFFSFFLFQCISFRRHKQKIQFSQPIVSVCLSILVGGIHTSFARFAFFFLLRVESIQDKQREGVLNFIVSVYDLALILFSPPPPFFAAFTCIPFIR